MQSLFLYSHFHLVGIQGVGMTALALILNDMGKEVTGSDIAETYLTKEVLVQRGIEVWDGFLPEHVTHAEVVVYSGAFGGETNSEIEEARKLGKTVLNLAEILGELSDTKSTIAIAGCHGKTTTTSLLSYVGEELGMNMSYYVGASGFMHHPPGKWQEGVYFAVEADEYAVDPRTDKTAKFLHLAPLSVICTNIDFDHPDVYSGIEEVKQAFFNLFLRIKNNGLLIVNGDDERLLAIAQESGKQMYSYGESAHNNYVISDIEYNSDTTKFVITFKDEKPLPIKLSLSGLHNVYNATAVFAFFHRTGVAGIKIVKALAGFTGVVRRLEHHSSVNGHEVFDDYAHHPTEIAATIEALKKKHPNHKIVVFFQPHTYTRTKAFKDEFIMSLSKADRVGILPIFASAREITDNNISTEELIREAKIRGITYFDIINTDADWKKIIHEVTASNKKGVFVTMGAGDIYKNTVFITNTLHEHE